MSLTISPLRKQKKITKMIKLPVSTGIHRSWFPIFFVLLSVPFFCINKYLKLFIQWAEKSPFKIHSIPREKFSSIFGLTWISRTSFPLTHPPIRPPKHLLSCHAADTLRKEARLEHPVLQCVYNTCGHVHPGRLSGPQMSETDRQTPQSG